MRTQPSFGFARRSARAAATTRIILMAKPDEEKAAEIARVARELAATLGLTGRLVAPERLHFTLHVLGTSPPVPRHLMEAAIACCDSISMPPFTVSLNRVMSFRRAQGVPPIVLGGDDGVIGLRMLHRTLGDALRARLFGRWRPLPFEPHMTLTYEGIAIEERAIEPIDLTIREFLLVNSLVGKSRHVVLARWPLDR